VIGDDPEEMSVGMVRLQQVVAENYVIVLVVLLLVGSGGAWATYTAHIDPGTRSEERTVSTWSRTGGFDHRATVSQSNPVYETGLRLTNQQAYFPRIVRTLSGEYSVRYSASDSGQLDIESTLELITRNSDDEVVFWETTRRLGRATVSETSPGESLTVPFEFNLSRTRVRLEQSEDVLGDPGESVVIVRAETRMTGTVSGRLVDRTFVDELQLRLEGNAFRVRDPGETTNSSSRTRTIQVEREYSPLWGVGGPVAMLLGIGGAAALVGLRRRGRLAPSDAALDRVVRAEYEEWLSRGTVPADFDPESDDVIMLAELVDLVDVAADTNRRVVYDPDEDWYVVPSEPFTYACCPPLHADDVSS